MVSDPHTGATEAAVRFAHWREIQIKVYAASVLAGDKEEPLCDLGDRESVIQWLAALKDLDPTLYSRLGPHVAEMHARELAHRRDMTFWRRRPEEIDRRWCRGTHWAMAVALLLAGLLWWLLR